MAQSIQLSGMNRAVPYSAGEAAAMQEIINMRMKDGAWRIVGDKRLASTTLFSGISGDPLHDKIYIHHTADGKEILCVPAVSAAGIVTIYYANMDSIAVPPINYASFATLLKGNDVNLYAMNNILMLGGGAFAVWNGSAYTCIPALPSNNIVRFSQEQADFNASDIETWSKFDDVTIQVTGGGSARIFVTFEGDYALTYEDGDIVIRNNHSVFIYDVCVYAFGAYHFYESGLDAVRIRNWGLPYFVPSVHDRSDTYPGLPNTGTKYIMIIFMTSSPPVIAPYIYKRLDAQNSLTTYVPNNSASIDDYVLAIDAIQNRHRSLMYKKSAVDGYVFLTSAFKLFDGSYVCYSAPVLLYLGNPALLPSDTMQYAQNNYLSIWLTTIDTKVAVSILNWKFGIIKVKVEALDAMYKNIISSIAIFVSAPICPTLAQKMKSVNMITIENHQVKIDYEDNEMPQQCFDNISNLHKILDIPFEEISNYADYKNIETDYTLLSTKPTMPADNLTAHSYKHHICKAYNKRMFMADTEVMLATDVNIISQPPYDTLPIELLVTFQTLLNINTSMLAVHHYYLMDTYYGGRYWDGYGVYFQGHCHTLLSYPDLRAYAINIKGKEYKLKQHPFFTLSYIFLDGGTNHAAFLTKISNSDPSSHESIQSLGGGSVAAVYHSDEYQERSIVRVSALNNPLYFDAINVYSLDGDVVGFGANALPVSTGQFGQHPMFVFTDRGIYAMQIGMADKVIENIVPMSGNICTDGKSITNLEQAIIFKTKEGIMLMAGAESKLISDALNEYGANPLYNNAAVVSALTHAMG
jgi:hypothetical protein